MLRNNKKNFTKLPESELQIMQLIWDMEKKGVKDIHAGALLNAYPEQIGHLALTTVLTLITRLQTKGFIQLEKHGRANCAIVLADENEYKRSFMSRMVRNYFANSYRDMVAFFVNEEHLSQEELDEIVQIIERGKPRK